MDRRKWIPKELLPISYYICPLVLAFRFLGFFGTAGIWDFEAPMVGGVIPFSRHILCRDFHSCLSMVRQTRLYWEMVEKLKGPNRVTLFGPDNDKGSVHSIYLEEHGVWWGGNKILSPYTISLVTESRWYLCHSGHHLAYSSLLDLSMGCRA